MPEAVKSAYLSLVCFAKTISTATMSERQRLNLHAALMERLAVRRECQQAVGRSNENVVALARYTCQSFARVTEQDRFESGEMRLS